MIILSEILDTSLKSCEINNIERFSLFCRSFNISIISFCIVTSKAVVGSSAIKSLGLQDKAMTIITLCFCPPEIWCGYLSNKFSTSSSFTFLISFSILDEISLLSMFSFDRNTSKSCSPIFIVGFSAVIGS